MRNKLRLSTLPANRKIEGRSVVVGPGGQVLSHPFRSVFPAFPQALRSHMGGLWVPSRWLCTPSVHHLYTMCTPSVHHTTWPASHSALALPWLRQGEYKASHGFDVPWCGRNRALPCVCLQQFWHRDLDSGDITTTHRRLKLRTRSMTGAGLGMLLEP
jgi:hypothetical protein